MQSKKVVLLTFSNKQELYEHTENDHSDILDILVMESQCSL